MEYIKAVASVEEFDNEEVVTTSAGCDQPQYDADLCDGKTQAVTKPF